MVKIVAAFGAAGEGTKTPLHATSGGAPVVHPQPRSERGACRAPPGVARRQRRLGAPRRRSAGRPLVQPLAGVRRPPAERVLRSPRIRQRVHLAARTASLLGGPRSRAVPGEGRRARGRNRGPGRRCAGSHGPASTRRRRDFVLRTVTIGQRSPRSLPRRSFMRRASAFASSSTAPTASSWAPTAPRRRNCAPECVTWCSRRAAFRRPFPG